MKRALAMALGAMMVAGSAAPAAAASHIDFSGYYRAYYKNEFNLGRQDNGYTDSYFGNRLHLDITFTPTDEIAVHWRLRGPHFSRWGQEGRNSIETKHIYGEIKQDWGTVYVGKLNEDFDNYGLASMGWQPSGDPMWTLFSPFDNGNEVDGVRYINRWDNGFQLIAQYGKVKDYWSNTDKTGGAGTYNEFYSDGDHDRFNVEGAYFWDGGGASLGFEYNRDATENPYNGAAKYGEEDRADYWFVNPAVMHSWGDFSVHFEGKFGWGTQEYAYSKGQAKVKDKDLSGYGLYLDMDYNYGPGNVMLAGWWVSGNAYDKKGTKSNALVDMGANFYPLVVAYNDTSSGTSRVSTKGGNSNANAVSVANDVDNFLTGGAMGAPAVGETFLNGGTAADFATFVTNGGAMRSQFRRDNGEANHWAIALAGSHAFTDDISMHYGVGYLSLVKPNYRVLGSVNHDGLGGFGTGYSGAKYTSQEKDLGWEVDLGFTFQLLDNLKFTTTFGYMFTGDAYKELKGYSAGDVTGLGGAAHQVKAVWKDGDDAYSWLNTLTFSF